MNQEKPIIIKLRETENEIVKIINDCNIPAFILKPVFERILNQLQILEQQEYENQIKLYAETSEKECDK